MIDGVTLTLAGLLLGIALFSINSRAILTGLGKFLVRKNIEKQNAKAGLVTQSFTLSSGHEAWYSERPAKAGTEKPPLVILPGATVSMEFMGAYMSSILQAMPERRILIIELPHHGRNLTADMNFSQPTDSIAGMADYLEEVRKTLAVGDAFDLLGYSLGGAIASEYAASREGCLRRLVLLAPYFYEATGDGFRAQSDAGEWLKIHGWESYGEMKQFFFEWLGMDRASALPSVVFRGLHGLREETYAPGYWTGFFEALDAASGSSKSFLSDSSAALAAVSHPVLLVCAEQDVICDPVKLRRLQALIGEENCELQEVRCGHAFGPGGETLFEISGRSVLQFLQVE